MKARHHLLITALCFNVACAAETEDGATGLSIDLALSVESGVAALRYEVTPVDCENGQALGPAQSNEVGLLDFAAPPVEGLPAFDPGAEHPFTDALFVLEPGCYDVRATPLDDEGQPSAVCAAASQRGVPVSEGVTTEILLVSQCNGREFGAQDSVALVNHAPELRTVGLEPSAFVGCGEVQRLCASLADPDGDRLEFVWSPAGTNPGLATPFVVERSDDGDSISECIELVPEQAGDYEVALTVFDLGLLNGAWTRIEDILALQPEPQPSRRETTLSFRADCAPELSAALSYTQVTNNRYCAAVAVQNNGEVSVDEWTVVLELIDSRLVADSEVGAELVTNGDRVTATSPAGSGPLLPGDSTNFSFCARKNGRDPSAAIVSVSAP